MGYRHIKLDKIVAGTEQRIFKTNLINISDNEIDQISGGMINTEIIHDVDNPIKYHEFDTMFFGEYSNELKTNAKIDGNSIYNANLIHFNELNTDYMINRPIEDNVSSSIMDVSIYNTSFSNWFKLKTLNNQKDNIKMSDERVTYFPKHLDMPIDVSLVENRAYFLSPLNTERYTNLIQCSANIVYRLFNMDADFKPNYNDTFYNYISKPYYYAEDNAIPIYDMCFSTLQTINLGNHENAQDWLLKWNLIKPEISSEIIFDSTTNISGSNVSDTFDSILVQQLLYQLEQGVYNYLYSVNNIKDILYDLFARIDINSIIRMIQPFGVITKSSDDLLNSFIKNNILSSDFKIPSSLIYNYLTEKQSNTFLTQSLPHNAIFISNITEELLFYKNKNNIIKSKLSDPEAATHIPSAYFDFIYLKNNQNPHYDYDLYIPNPNIDLNEFKIYTDTKQYVNDSSMNPMSSYINPYNGIEKDQSALFNSKFDFDGTASIKFNSDPQYNIVTNKARTTNILNYGIKRDNELADNNYEYNENYPVRLSNKMTDYLSVFEHRHINTNKIYNIGEILGLRNYIKSGQVLSLSKLWLSYKYSVSYDQLFIDSFAKTFISPYKIYNLQRYDNHTEQVIQGFVQYEGENDIKYMKKAGMNCPYRVSGKNFQQVSGCKLDINKDCRGYCPFPAYGKCGVSGTGISIGDYYPTGITWSFTGYKESKDMIVDSINGFNQINDEWFVMNAPTNLSNELILETDSDISVADDIEIYFINKDFGSPNKSLEQNLSDLKNELLNYNELQFKSLYQGFGGYTENNRITYPEYMLVNSDLISTHIISEERYASSYLLSLKDYVSQMDIKNINTNLGIVLSTTMMSEFLSTYLNISNGSLINNDTYNDETSGSFYTMLNNITYSDVLSLSNNKNLSSFLYHTIDEFENEGDTIITALIDNNIISSTLNEIYNTNIGLYINDELSSYPLKNHILNTNLIYNNFVISPTSPFNGPHIIPAGNIITAYHITGKDGKIINISSNKVNSFGKNDMIIMRIKNWWSNSAYCIGKFKIKQKNPITYENYKNNPLFVKLFNTISNFDHVECVKGLFKYQQNDIKKSNVYSLKLTNSGLNPSNDISANAFNKYKFLIENDYYQLSPANRSLYTSYYWTDIEKNYPTWINDIIQCIIDNNTIGITSEEQFLLHMSLSMNQQAQIFMFDEDKANNLNNIRQDLRNIIEDAIKSSIKRYMPVHTNLWKIIYSGK